MRGVERPTLELKSDPRPGHALDAGLDLLERRVPDVRPVHSKHEVLLLNELSRVTRTASTDASDHMWLSPARRNERTVDSWRVRGAGVRAGVLVLLLLGLLGNARCFNVVLIRGCRTTDFLITVSAPDTGGNRAAFSAAFSLRSKLSFCEGPKTTHTSSSTLPNAQKDPVTDKVPAFPAGFAESLFCCDPPNQPNMFLTATPQSEDRPIRN